VALGVSSALAVGVLPSPASAQELQASQNHEFMVGSTSCTVRVRSTFDPETHLAEAHTDAFDSESDPECSPAVAVVTVTYTDVTGARERITANGGGDVNLHLEDVERDFSAQHEVLFINCRCSSPTYTTTPK
jgi:hypothetical protein